jgi:hypothetical protein
MRSIRNKLQDSRLGMSLPSPASESGAVPSQTGLWRVTHYISVCRRPARAAASGRLQSVLRSRGGPSPRGLGHCVWWPVGPEWSWGCVPATGMWSGCFWPWGGLLWCRLRRHLPGQPPVFWDRTIPGPVCPLRLVGAQLWPPWGCQCHLLRYSLSDVTVEDIWNCLSWVEFSIHLPIFSLLADAKDPPPPTPPGTSIFFPSSGNYTMLLLIITNTYKC